MAMGRLSWDRFQITEVRSLQKGAEGRYNYTLLELDKPIAAVAIILPFSGPTEIGLEILSCDVKERQRSDECQYEKLSWIAISCHGLLFVVLGCYKLSWVATRCHGLL